MTITTDGSGTADGRESDSEKIDRIADFVRDQRKADKSWTERLAKLTVYLALAAFFFGVGTFADLRSKLAAPAPTPAQSAKAGYLRAVDDYCKGFVDVRPSASSGSGFGRIAADDLAVLTARNRMNLAWNTFSIPAQMAPQDVGAFESIRSYYFAAGDLLQAAVGRARAADIDGYALDIGLYRQTNAAFLTAATDFGFTNCNHYWTVDDVPMPAH